MDLYTQFNPIFDNIEEDENLKKYDLETRIKIKNTNFKDWICSICYESCDNKEIDICYPFNCDHSFCFSCFVKLCEFTIKKQKKRGHTVRCPMCREKPTKNWIDKERVKQRTHISDGIIVNVKFPY